MKKNHVIRDIMSQKRQNIKCHVEKILAEFKKLFSNCAPVCREAWKNLSLNGPKNEMYFDIKFVFNIL